MRDIKPLLLVLLSIGLVSTWVYHIYDKANNRSERSDVHAADSAMVAGAIKDSLNSLYSAALRDLDTRLDSTQVNCCVIAKPARQQTGRD